MKCLFSIIVPVYNVEKYIEECLRSMVSQLKKIDNQCEIILIDDGSTDSSGSICDRYMEEYPDIIKVFHNKNQGLLLTRRFGYERAQGDYIINCDSDDFFENDALFSIKETIFCYDEPDIILFNHYKYDNGKQITAFENIFSNDHVYKCSKNEVIVEFLRNNKISSLWSGAYKRTVVDTDIDYSKYKNISNGEDSLQKIEWIDRAESFIYLNKPLYNYRVGSGMTSKYDPDYYKSFKTVVERIISKKNSWNLEDFENLVAAKLMSVAGRAITQSRFNKKLQFKEHVQYLKNIKNDELFCYYEPYFDITKVNLQRDHIILLKMLIKKKYGAIVLMLRVKNMISEQ